MNVFQKIAEDERIAQEKLTERRKMLDQIRRGDVNKKQRLAELKEKARKAELWINNEYFIYFEEYITDLIMEIQISIKELGLNGKSSQEIGDKVRELSVASNILERMLKEPKDLIKIVGR